MDENEFLKRENEKVKFVLIFAFLFLILSPFVFILSLHPYFTALETPAMFFVVSMFLVGVFYYVWSSYSSFFEKAEEIWYSMEKIREINEKLVKWVIIICLIGFIEVPTLFYLILEYNMFYPEFYLLTYIVSVGMFAITYPLAKYVTKVSRKRFGNSRAIRVNVKEKEAEEIVKRALNDLKVDYGVKEGNPWKGIMWEAETKNGMRIQISPEGGNKSKIIIYKIPPDWTEKEREIEKEILRLIHMESHDSR